MNKTNDIVIGAVTNCHFHQIELWCNSLDQSGFSGTKALIVYALSNQLRDTLEQKGYKVIDGKHLERKIVVQRFKDIPELVVEQLGSSFRYVIATDVFDVVFQSDPSNWLTENMNSKLVNVGSECIRYKDESWGQGNLISSFGHDVYNQHKDNVIYNAGTVAGDFNSMMSLFMDIYNLSITSSIDNADQAALNILIHSDKYKDVTNFASMESAWCCQAGTVAHPDVVNRYRPYLTEPEPVFNGGECFTSKCQMFTLVHQYNRVPQWQDAFNQIYRK